ncbi:MAG: TetR/AcrR family transcriptional regulator [Thermotogota bacterium]
MKKSDLTKQKIIDCTINLIYENGFDNTTTKSIAKCSGVSEATIFKYYKSKKDLLKSILKAVIKKFKKYSTEEVLPTLINKHKDESIEKLLKEVLKERSIFIAKNFPLIKIILQEMLINEEIKTFFLDNIWKEMEKFSNFIFDLGKKTGEFKNVDNNIIRKLTFGVLIYTVIEKSTLEKNVKPETIEIEMEKIIETVMKGLRSDKNE